jgi:diamine N-acetyltransferase
MAFIKGTQTALRPLEITDLDVLCQWENDSDHLLLGNTLTPFSRFFLEQYILGSNNKIYEDRQLRLVIEGPGGEAVGLIDLFDFDPHHRRAAVGILIGKAHREKGFASEALDLVIEYAGGVLGLKQLYATADAGNNSSKALFLKKGFVLAGTKRQWNLRGRHWVDEDFLQLIF